METPIRIAIFGALGRMGRELTDAATGDAAFEIAALVERPDHPGIGESIGGVEVVADGEPLPAGIDVAVDFSSSADAVNHAAACADGGIALVVAVTGLTFEDESAILNQSNRIPVFRASNFSIGITALAHYAEKMARDLADFDVEIVEMHHRDKKDAPSGTAAALARAIEDARPGLRWVHCRERLAGPRDPNEIGIHSLRGGDVVGDHTVVFAGDGERIELTHRAGSRRIFASGALRAARYVAGRNPGVYTMGEMLFLEGLDKETDG